MSDFAFGEYDFPDREYFPETVELWRFDQEDRVQNGMMTARTLLAHQAGTTEKYGYLEEDVALHLLSSYASRLDSPSRTHSGVGSPFISASFQPRLSILESIKGPGELEQISLYRLSIPRNRIIIPKMFQMDGQPDWQKYAFEVLIIGDVAMSAIERVSSAKDFNSQH